MVTISGQKKEGFRPVRHPLRRSPRADPPTPSCGALPEILRVQCRLLRYGRARERNDLPTYRWTCVPIPGRPCKGRSAYPGRTSGFLQRCMCGGACGDERSPSRTQLAGRCGRPPARTGLGDLLAVPVLLAEAVSQQPTHLWLFFAPSPSSNAMVSGNGVMRCTGPFAMSTVV